MPIDHAHKLKKNTAYGQWASTITTDLIVSDSVSLDEVRQVGESLYYIERRPHEAGRCVIVKHTDGTSVDILPEAYSANSRVHEYGGGCYCIHGEQVFFINDSDQDIYLIEKTIEQTIDKQEVLRITDDKNKRFADFSFDENLQRLIAICETHLNNTIVNEIVAIDIANGNITVLEAGNDF